MRIKPRPKITRKQRSYLKWMGLLPPKKKGRLHQLNKLNRRLKKIHNPERVDSTQEVWVE